MDPPLTGQQSPIRAQLNVVFFIHSGYMSDKQVRSEMYEKNPTYQMGSR